MTTYTTINNNEVDADSPITESLLTRLRDNPIAITEGATGAPTIQAGALANGCVRSDTFAAGSINESKIAAGAVHTAALDTSIGEVTFSGNISLVLFGYSYGQHAITLPGGTWGFYPQLKASNTWVKYRAEITLHASTTWNTFLMPTTYQTGLHILMKVHSPNSNAYTGTGYARQRYINSSPPYNIGNGDISHFIYVQIDNTTGDVISTYAADAPPWAYNGPTDISADFYDKQGKAWRFKRAFAKSDELTGDFEQDQVKLQDSILKRRLMKQAREGVADWSTLTDYIEPVTHDIKNADMPLIPQPFGLVDNTTTVLINPTSPIVDKLAILAEENQSISELLHNEHLIIDNDAVDVAAPPGVKIVNAKWKNSGLNND